MPLKRMIYNKDLEISNFLSENISRIQSQSWKFVETNLIFFITIAVIWKGKSNLNSIAQPGLKIACA